MSSTNSPELPESEWAKDFPRNKKLPVIDSLEFTPDRRSKERELDGDPDEQEG